MNPHVHFSPTQTLFTVAVFVALFGSMHLLCLTRDNRFTRGWLSLGF